MTGRPTFGSPIRTYAKDEFVAWLRDWPEGVKEHIRIYGKPVVRVPVERQTPNEADL